MKNIITAPQSSGHRASARPNEIKLFGWLCLAVSLLFCIGRPAYAQTNFIGGGTDNVIETSLISAGIIGGQLNTNDQASYGFIGGGSSNYMNAPDSAIIAGAHNQMPNLGSLQDYYSVIAGGQYNTNAEQGSDGFIGGGFWNLQNAIASTIVGGVGNQILQGSNNGIVAGFSNTIDDQSPVSIFIGGGSFNSATWFATQCAIAGGYSNTITSSDGNDNSNDFIGAGSFNTNLDAQSSGILSGLNNLVQGAIGSTIAGGFNNLVGGPSISSWGFIGGGYNNEIYSDFGYASGNSILGGHDNLISDTPFAVLIGGQFNTNKGCNGGYSTMIAGSSNYIGINATYNAFILGGAANSNFADSSGILGGISNQIGWVQTDGTLPEPLNCLILGGFENAVSNMNQFLAISNSVAGGQKGTIIHNNTFMWNDGTGVYGMTNSTADDQFIVNASGGIYLNGVLFSGGTGGGVSSVAMTGDGTLFNSSVPGSPIVSTGTLAPTLLNQSANTVFAGPSSGGAAAPTFQTAPTFSGANLTSLNASSLASGTVPYAQLPSAVITNYNAAGVWLDQYLAIPGTGGANAIGSFGLNIAGGTTSLDGSAITTDGAGNLYANSLTAGGNFWVGGGITSDGTLITTDGAGNMTVGSISGDGGGLTNIAGSNIVESVYKTTTGFTLTATNSIVLINGTGQTVTLPSAVGITGKTYTIKLIHASTMATVATTSSQDIDGATTYSLTAQYKSIKVVSDGAQWWNIASN